ncbi:MAG: hypothetical protein BZY75_01895 [SAR202 cluster bacterium Io17-Chloro-G7]|nr:MAG: hypothetical protein BZY75_01895 [SAR202 cluster bacterium Io17-Chloro-G7]
MNKETIQAQMDELRDELNRVDALQVALEAALRAHESLFKAISANGVKQTRQLALGVPGRGGGPKGSVSFRSGVIEVLKQARGEELHADIIWERMQAMGVKSEAKRPRGFVSMIAAKEEDIEKSAPGTFRWVGASPQDSIKS